MFNPDRIYRHVEFESDLWSYSLFDYVVPYDALDKHIKIDGQNGEFIMVYDMAIHAFETRNGHRWDCLNGWTR